ncbi:MAG TPA: hypothetical protein VK808_01970 [Bacteroidia bacterium]|jgi:hypothetical protein|nr:hypothetical protein [Bacteroidia bacterium]
MKKYPIYFTILLAGFSVNSIAQAPQPVAPAQTATSAQTSSSVSFQTGSLIVTANFGIDGYALKQHEVNNYNGQTYDTNTGAASRNFSIGAEYGVAKWLGLGLQFKFDNYYHDWTLQSALGVESGLIVNAHMIRHRHFDLLAGLNIGVSNLTITSIYNNYQIYGSGSWVDLHFTAREYIGKFGFSETLYFPDINYNNLSSNVPVFNEYIVASWKATGVGFNWGIQYHFLK